MNAFALGLNDVWAGVCALAVGILFTTPPRHLAGTFCCAVAGRIARDLLMGWGMTPNWATMPAAMVVVLVAVAILRGHVVSSVVLVSGVLPLAAAVSVFKSIIGVLRVSTLQGPAAGAEVIALVANVGRSFTVTLAIALGLAAGLAVVRLLGREGITEKA